MSEGDAFSDQTVKIRCMDQPVSKRMNRIETLLIGVNQEDVGLHTLHAKTILLHTIRGAPFVQGIQAAARLKLKRLVNFLANQVFLDTCEFLN